MFQWELKLKVEIEMILSKNLAKIAKKHDKTSNYIMSPRVDPFMDYALFLVIIVIIVIAIIFPMLFVIFGQ